VLYLANPVSEAAIAAMGAGLLGMIDTPYQGKVKRVNAAHAAGATWCADNGAFSDRWQADEWWTWLTADRQMNARDRCLFATAPDVVADADATWERARPWIPRIRDLGYPVAYVAQDGLTEMPWPELDVVFLGGSDLFKLGPEARRWTRQAVERGVPVHMGRVNSELRYRYAHAIGCSTVDGTYLTFRPDRGLPEVLAWQRHVGQQTLFDHHE
jgi:hypothetical protein